MLLQLDGNGHAGEGFRVALEGDRLETDIWTSDVFTASELGGFRLRLEVKTTAVELRPNTLSSRWEDIITLVNKGSLVAFRPDAAEDCSAEFKQIYSEVQQSDPRLGAAIRWAVQAKNDSSLRLVLQCLPATADRLRSEPRLTADDGPAMHLEILELEAEMLEKEDGRGPVPIFFARNPPEVWEVLAEHPERVETGTRALL